MNAELEYAVLENWSSTDAESFLERAWASVHYWEATKELSTVIAMPGQSLSNRAKGRLVFKRDEHGAVYEEQTDGEMVKDGKAVGETSFSQRIEGRTWFYTMSMLGTEHAGSLDLGECRGVWLVPDIRWLPCPLDEVGILGLSGRLNGTVKSLALVYSHSSFEAAPGYAFGQGVEVRFFDGENGLPLGSLSYNTNGTIASQEQITTQVLH